MPSAKANQAVMSSLFAEHLLSELRTHPGRTVAELAVRLGQPEDAIRETLRVDLRGQVVEDRAYRWSPADGVSEPDSRAQVKEDFPLARLCRYYMDCLSRDGGGEVSCFATSKFGDDQYLELGGVEEGERQTNPLASPAVREFVMRAAAPPKRASFWLGYPTRLHLVRGRSGWEGFKAEPLLLFPLEVSTSAPGALRWTDELPTLNMAALRRLAAGGAAATMHEAIALAEELGIDGSLADRPALADVVTRLATLRPEWDWVESANPHELPTERALSDLAAPGIYNRAVLVASEQSPYTQGLEYELNRLAKVDQDNLAGTALGAWLERTTEARAADATALLEVLPLNSEQRDAVERSLSNDLTVITGPPGTGKSQVVSNILINAAYDGQTVLFASKNNRAVDVVETRVNALASRPLLLRFGTTSAHARVAGHLLSLLSTSVSAEEEHIHDLCAQEHAALRSEIERLEASAASLLELRNQVDSLEEGVEPLRAELGETGFAAISDVKLVAASAAVERLTDAIHRALRSEQSFRTRLVWPLIRQRRFAALAAVALEARLIADQLQVELPGQPIDSETVGLWADIRTALGLRLENAARIHEYREALERLSSSPPLEQTDRELEGAFARVTENSHALWQAWLGLQPARITKEQRHLIGRYVTMLNLLANAGEDARAPRSDVKKFHELFPKLTSLFPCWGVTSLSARGRLPLQPAFFDLLVIDEASQCDIASALPLLFRARRAVIIGDPQQLRHISRLSPRQDLQLLRKHDLVESYGAWSYSTASLFDLAAMICDSSDIVTLRDHHRSHSDIIAFSNRQFYDGRLRMATRYENLRFPPGKPAAVRWVNVAGRVRRPPTGGAVNDLEARAVVDELVRLAKGGYAGTVGVVSPFRAQVTRIRDLLGFVQSGDEAQRLRDLLVDTVHAFQGDERDVILFSPVISRDAPEGALLFLRKTPNLFNVAITRARAALIAVGDIAAARESGVDYLANFATYATTPQGGEEAPPASAVGELTREYPTVARPQLVSDWERTFYQVLFDHGIRTLPQYPVDKYVLDFAILTEDGRRLNIEIDGERYHREWTGELRRLDRIRNQRLMELGWDVMRFWVYQIRDDNPRCIQRITEWIAATGRP